MNIIKKSIPLIAVFVCVAIASNFAVFAKLEGVTTVSSDHFAQNGLDNVVGTDYQTTFSPNGNAKIVKNADDSVTFSVTGNGTSQSRGAVSGNWEKTGTLVVTFDYQFTGTIPTGGTYTHQMNLHIGNWFNGPILKNDGNKYTIKAEMDLNDVTDGKVTLKWYEKSFGANDSSYALVASSPNTKPTDVSVLQPHWKVTTADYPDGSDYYDGMTIDNFNISEKPVPAPALQDLSGNNYSTEDSIDVNIFLPDGYQSATLKFDTVVVAEYVPATFTAGSYKTTVPLTTFEGTNVPVTLSVTISDASTAQTCTTKIDKVTDPSKRVLEINSLSGKDYGSNEYANISFYLPVGYTEAELKIGETTVKTYAPANYAGGTVHNDSIPLKNFSGRNIPVVLTATVGEVTQTATTSIDSVTDAFVPEFTDFPKGIYITADTVEVGISLPEGYSTAEVTVNDTVTNRFSSSTSPAGEYTVEIPLANFSGVNVPVSLTAVVDGSTKSASDTIDSVVAVGNYTSLATEDFSGSEYSISIINGSVVDGVLVDNASGANHCAKLTGLSIPNGYCAEIEYDIKLTHKNSFAGAFVRGNEKNSTGGVFPKPGGWFYGQENEKFSYNTDITYALNEWNRVKYRLFATQDKIHVYLDGKYVGSTPMIECYGFTEIGIGWNTAGYDTYIDNVNIKSWTPHYSATVSAVKDGADAEFADYTNPKIKISFDMLMSAASVSEENISITSFNGRKIAYDGVYDSATKSFVITPRESLIAGKEYTVTINDKVKSIAGIANNETTFAVKTANQPLRISSSAEERVVASGVTSIDVPVSVEASSGDNATIFVALYKDGKLVSIKAVNVVDGTLSASSVSLNTNGAGTYKVAYFMCRGINDYSAIDDAKISE